MHHRTITHLVPAVALAIATASAGAQAPRDSAARAPRAAPATRRVAASQRHIATTKDVPGRVAATATAPSSRSVVIDEAPIVTRLLRVEGGGSTPDEVPGRALVRRGWSVPLLFGGALLGGGGVVWALRRDASERVIAVDVPGGGGTSPILPTTPDSTTPLGSTPTSPGVLVAPPSVPATTPTPSLPTSPSMPTDTQGVAAALPTIVVLAEPSSFVLLAMGLVGVFGAGRSRRLRLQVRASSSDG